MLSVQQLADIATRHLTRMADAMLLACAARAVETGEPLRIPEREARGTPTRGARQVEHVAWRRMVERNGDTRWQHT